MRCPIDQTDLLISDRNGIEIDYCPKCRGVWLDRGELDKIIERAAGAYPQAAAPRAADPVIESRRYEERRYDERHDDDYYEDKRKNEQGYHKPKKKSILEEIFDF